MTPAGRRPRYTGYRYAPWPDPELLAQEAGLQGLPVVYRTALEHGGGVSLTVDFSDNLYAHPHRAEHPVTSGNGVPKPHSRLLRLRWHGEVHALESHNSFYAAALLENPPQVDSNFIEVVSDPNPWIADLIAEGAGVFPPYGFPVQVSPAAALQNPQWLPPTGRFYPVNAPTREEYEAALLFGRDPGPLGPGNPPPPNVQPRYRHLMILSESHVLEVLSDELPRLEVIEDRSGG